MNLDQDRFFWTAEVLPTGEFPVVVRLSPREGGQTLSFRRKVALRAWCEEQFGPEHEAFRLDGETFAFVREEFAVLFVLLWNGATVEPASLDVTHAYTSRVSGVRSAS